MIVLCGGIKGGSGKTTVATNLAVMRAIDGHDVLLVDADDQETASDFTTYRNESTDDEAGYTAVKLTGKAVRTELHRLQDKYDDIVIDTGGRDTTSQRAALTVADALLVPFVPRSFDIWTLDAVADLVEEISAINPDLRALAFINRADPRGSDNAEAAAVLKESPLEFLNSSLGNRKSFANAAAAGLSVVEIKPSDPKAIKEVKLLYKLIFNSK